MAYIETNRPISAIFVDLVNQFTALVRKEGQLARAEISEKLGEIGIGLGLVVGGAVLLIPALVILLQATVAGLAAAGLAVGWASLGGRRAITSFKSTLPPASNFSNACACVIPCSAASSSAVRINAR